MIHKDKEKAFFCTMMLSMHINSLSFSVSVWLNYNAAIKQMTKWMLLTQEPTLFVFMFVTQEPTIRKMSAVTHAFHIMNWMLTQEPTFFIFMVVTQESTIRKFQLLLMYFTPRKYSLLKRHHQSKPKFRCQKFLRRSIHGCMRTCNKFSRGVCWDS